MTPRCDPKGIILGMYWMSHPLHYILTLFHSSTSHSLQITPPSLSYPSPLSLPPVDELIVEA